ncbi:uncharacterized protein LOC142337687 [Convolutriloba macropyga]|uniref:uncharacterized protein LOC142337687 n=1 Tax=Convolutriloba macropyga TaxID=536237 RepID=UPI003F520046
MSQFKKTYDGTKLKTNLKLSVNRLKLLEKKKNEQNLKARKEISEYLQACKYDRARVRVEGIIREDYLVEALEMVEMNCELLHGRIGILETTSNEAVPLDLEECLSNILFAAPRIYQEVAEMSEISKHLQRKFKKDVFAQLQQNCSRKANQKLVSRLDIRPPPKALVEAYLVEIADSHKVEFKPDPLALDGSIDTLNAADFEAPNLINFGGTENPQQPTQPPYPQSQQPNQSGYPPNAQYAPPGIPPMNPNYPSTAGQGQQPLQPMVNPYGGGNQMPYPQNGQQPPYQVHGYIPNGQQTSSNGMPPSYEEDEKKRPPNGGGSGNGGDGPGSGGSGGGGGGTAAANNLQQWSNLELPQIPTDFGGNNSNNNSGGGGQGVPPSGNAGAGAGNGSGSGSLDMDDLEARLNRLKGL